MLWIVLARREVVGYTAAVRGNAQFLRGTPVQALENGGSASVAADHDDLMRLVLPKICDDAPIG
jgi:hypothetical protein